MLNLDCQLIELLCFYYALVDPPPLGCGLCLTQGSIQTSAQSNSELDDRYLWHILASLQCLSLPLGVALVVGLGEGLSLN